MIESRPAGLLHLHGISSKISRIGCNAPAQTQAFRGDPAPPLLRLPILAARSAAGLQPLLAVYWHLALPDPSRRAIRWDTTPPPSPRIPTIRLWQNYRRCFSNAYQARSSQ